MAVSVPAYAVMADSSPRTVTLPDGNTVTLVLHGDEYFNYTTTAEGNTVVFNTDNGVWEYACVSPVDGSLVPTGERAVDGLRSLTGVKNLKPAINPVRQNADNIMRVHKAPARYDYSKFRGLVILVEYNDAPFSRQDIYDIVNDMVNKRDYDGYMSNTLIPSKVECTGSVRDYYYENSNGKFDPQFDVVGPVQINYSQHYANQSAGAQTLVSAALRAADEQVDYTLYDTDGNRQVDMVYFIFSGGGSNHSGNDATLLWPHASTVMNLSLDGVSFGRYACSTELYGAPANKQLDGIGTICHEFSHVLGLPDLYGTGANHPAKYSLMASGNYNNDGRTPPNFSAFERFCLGWLEPRDLVHPKSVELEPIAANEAWRIPTGRVNEFFLLENRQTDGWDIDIPGHGLLVWHIDYNPDIWERNMVNRNNGHQYVDIVEANGGTSASQAAGFTFPGAGRKTSLTAETYPALRDWAGNAIDMPLTSITETPEGTVKFDAKGGKAEVGGVAGLTVETISPVEIAVAWQATAGAEAYEVMVRTQGGTIGEAVAFMTVHTTSANVGGLKPGGSYDVSVAARDEFEIGRPSAVTVVMPDGTLEFMAPEFAGVTDVTDTGFSLEWLPLGGATYYELTVAEIVPGELTAVKTGFDGKAIPDGWWLDGTTWISAPGNYATSAPALRFEAEGSSLTIDAGKKVRSVSFWCRGTKVTPGSCIAVEISDGASWQQAASVAIPAEATTAVAEIPAVLAGNTGLVRLRFVKDGSCTAAIDDIVVTAGDEVEAVLPEWDARDTGNTLSAVVYGLKPSTDYLCTIVGKSGEQRSLSSKPLRVSTKSFSGIGDIPAEPAAGMVAVAFITPDGRVYSLGTNMPKGICIVRYADGSVRKLLIR